MSPSLKRYLWPSFTLAAFAAGLTTGIQKGKILPFAAKVLDQTMVQPAVKKSAAAVKLDARTKLVDVLGTLNPAARSSQLQALANEGFEADPAAAWAMNHQIASVEDRETYCVGLLQKWAAANPQAAVNAASTLPPGRLHTAAMAAALEGMARQNAGEALDYATQHLVGAARETSLDSVVQAWAETNPQAAAGWALKNLSTPGAAGTLRAAVNTWADSNPSAASQWVAGLPAGSASSTARSALVETWSEQSPAEVAAWISSQGVRADMDAPAEDLAAKWAASDPKAAAEWAATLPRTMTARSAASRAVGEWAAVDPLEAAAWVAEKAPDLKKIAPALQRSVGASWAGQDAPAAAAWIQSLGDAWAQTDTAPTVFNIWAATDSEGLSAWIAQNPATQVTDTARSQLALIHSNNSPTDAMNEAFQLSNPQAAAGLGRQIFNNWKSRDLTAANAWAAANPQATQMLQQVR